MSAAIDSRNTAEMYAQNTRVDYWSLSAQFIMVPTEWEGKLVNIRHSLNKNN